MEPLRQNKFLEYIPYIIPVIGVALFGWSPLVILFYFCVENLLRGAFFVLRGLVMVFNSGGIGFLIVFSLLYFTHATLLFQSIFSMAPDASIQALPSMWAIVLNILILSIPHFAELRIFARSSHEIENIYAAGKREKISKKEIAERMKEQDVIPMLDFIFDVKEMFNRIIILWLTLPVAWILLFITTYLNVPIVISGALLIAVFSCIHYKFENYAREERQKIWNKHVEWKKTQAATVGGEVAVEKAIPHK